MKCKDCIGKKKKKSIYSYCRVAFALFFTRRLDHVGLPKQIVMQCK